MAIKPVNKPVVHAPALSQKNKKNWYDEMPKKSNQQLQLEIKQLKADVAELQATISHMPNFYAVLREIAVNLTKMPTPLAADEFETWVKERIGFMERVNEQLWRQVNDPAHLKKIN